MLLKELSLVSRLWTPLPHPHPRLPAGRPFLGVALCLELGVLE